MTETTAQLHADAQPDVIFRRCSRCVMDTLDRTDAHITFDEEGRCNYCTAFLLKAPGHTYRGAASDAKREELLADIRKAGEGHDYDCVVGISGGVDSSYLCYQAKKLGLRPLAVHFDNGWNSELAVMNVERIVKKLDVDYQTYVVDWEEFRDLQLAFLRASIANAEIPTDHGILASLYRVAMDHGVKCILTGSNFATEGIMPENWAYNQKDLRHLKAIHRRFGTTPLKTFPTLGMRRELTYTYLKQIKRRRLLEYIDYVKEDAMKVLQDELEWVYYGGKHYESVFTRFFQGYILPVKFGIDKRKAHLSTLICSGQMTRDEALAELEGEIYPADMLETDRQYVIKKLQLSEEEFAEIMGLPVKSSHDYPNGDKLVKPVYALYNKVRRDRAVRI